MQVLEGRKDLLSVLGLLKDGRSRTVEDLVVDLLVMTRKAMHELPFGRSTGGFAELWKKEESDSKGEMQLQPQIMPG